MAENKKEIKKRKKIAAIMLALGDDVSAKVLKYLEELDLHMLGNEMTFLDKVSPKELEEYMNEFLKELGKEPEVEGGLDNIKKILIKAFGEEKAKQMIEKMGTPLKKIPFYSLANIDPKMIANFIKNEHPQTIAVILAHLTGPQAAETLANLPENLQTDVVLRIAKLETVSPDVVNELEKALEEEVKSAGGGESHQVGGIEPVAEILNNVPKEIEQSILETIEEDNPEIAEEIRKKMFVFEDLVYVDDRGIQSILKEVSNEDLLLALKTATEGIKEKIFKNMSSRAADMIKEDLEAMGPVKLSDVEKAQMNIIQVAKRLEDEGKIVVAKGGAGGEVVV